LKEHLFDVKEFLKRIGEETYDNQDKKDIKAKQEEPKNETQQTPPKIDKDLQKKIKKLETKIKNAEQKIESLETDLAAKTKALEMSDFNDTVNYQNQLDNYNKTKKELDQVMENWENALLELESLKA
jgi:ATP-binding cassette subfamily F protein 3